MKKSIQERELSIGKLFSNDRNASRNEQRIHSINQQIQHEINMQEMAMFACVNIWVCLLQLASIFFVMTSHQRNLSQKKGDNGKNKNRSNSLTR